MTYSVSSHLLSILQHVQIKRKIVDIKRRRILKFFHFNGRLTALSDDYFRDFAKKCKLPQEKQENKDIEDTNLENSFLEFVKRFFLTINPEGVQVLLKLSFQILEFYQVMLIHTFKDISPQISGKFLKNTYEQFSHGHSSLYIFQLVLIYRLL